ncbi:MAG: response regulator [Pseudorhodoplanes sp.]
MTGTPRVLVVEDEVLIRMLAVDMLADQGFAPDEAGTAAEALAKLQEPGANYAMIFLDIGLPDKRGDDLINEVRKFQPALPLLVASGEDIADLRSRLQHHHPIGFLGKPYDSTRLEQAIDALRQASAV